MKPILFTFAFAATLAAQNFIQKIAGSPCTVPTIVPQGLPGPAASADSRCALAAEPQVVRRGEIGAERF